MNYKIIFRPICWIQEIYYTFRYGVLVCGHDYVIKDSTVNPVLLVCEICGKESK
jgi:hypothetical protein